MKPKKGLPSFPGSRLLYLGLTLVIILEAASILAQAVFLGRAITFIFHGEPMDEVIKSAWLFLAAFLIRHGLAHLEQIAAEGFAKRTVTDLRKEVVESYFHLGPRFAQRKGTGELVTLAIEGMEKLKTYLEITIPKMLRAAIIPVLIVIYVFTIDKTSAFILIATIPIVVVFMILLGYAAKKMADSQYETYRVLSNHFIDSLKGLETLKFLGKSKQHEGNITRVSSQYRKATMKTLRIAFLSSFALDFFTSLSIAFVAVGLGYRLIEGYMVLLPALTVLILAPEYFLPLRQLGMDFHATLDGQVALKQVDNIIKQSKKVEQTETNKEMAWNDSSVLSLKQVTVFHEEAERPVLSDISFNWQGNGFVGIVGESGAGKSTLIDVLAGYLEYRDGEITVNQEKVDSLACANWQQNIAYIPQHPHIFSGSLADNIRFYEPDVSDEVVEKVVEKIGLTDLVASFSKGIHEPIGEGGRALSGGQEQRIAMARALLSERPIILLDEPTAHLDIETEYEIKQTMLQLFKDKLVFLATHRLHWMKEMDHIIVLKNGQIVAEGKHEELLTKNDTYEHLVRMTVGGDRHEKA